MQLDSYQDCLNFKIRHLKGLTKFTFQRAFDTCDDGTDYIIEVSISHGYMFIVSDLCGVCVNSFFKYLYFIDVFSH